MGEAADDAYEAAEREQGRRRALMAACGCARPHWEPDEDGLMECLSCGTVVDE